MNAAAEPNAPAETPAIANAAEAAQAIETVSGILDRLIDTVEDETEHLRAGRLRDALALEATKSELARSYAAETARLREARTTVARLAPDTLKSLRHRHDRFQSLLQTNLTVLATAHAVSEGIIRGVSGELAKKRTPSTYGAHGRANAPDPKAARPMAVSRSL
ncbi:MAG: hypothetical protein WCA36_00565 [Pseudolabrys sp.]|jgi:flagellar biosynthesis/type III secretory pathway chaperone